VIAGHVHILKVRVFDSFGENAFEVSIEAAPKLDPSLAPSFTAKQGQYLAFIYNYARSSRYDQDPGTQWFDRAKPGTGPIHAPPCTG